MRLPEPNSRWRDIETGDEVRVENVTSGEVVFTYTHATSMAAVGQTQRMAVAMFEHFWREFPSVWDRLQQSD